MTLEVRHYFCEIIDWSSIGRCQLINRNRLPLIDRLIFRLSIPINCLGPVFTDFQHTKLYLYFSLGFTQKMFLKFRKLQSGKECSIGKQMLGYVRVKLK